MCGQHNVRASAGDNTGQNTDEGHTPNPRTEIKIPSLKVSIFVLSFCVVSRMYSAHWADHSP